MYIVGSPLFIWQMRSQESRKKGYIFEIFRKNGKVWKKAVN